MIDYMKQFRLDGKTSYVVGGLGLIGKEISIAYAQAGSKTIVLDLDSKTISPFQDETRYGKYDIHYRSFDCANIDRLEKNFSTLLKENGPPDVFINCSYPRTADWGHSSFKDITLDSFRQNVDIQMNSCAWLAKLVAESMVRNKKSGSIIQLGSTYGVVGQDLTIYKGTEMTENMSYAAIKGGITNLTRLMASYYGQYNIRVNTLCPGGLEGHVAGKSKSQNPDFVREYSSRIPLNRLGLSKEIASTALFLASNASSYITGATIMVDGGWTAI